MVEGNRHYEAGRFAEAVAEYQALADAGAEDSVLYYNLGNAYYKLGDLGHAVLNYRRAQQLAPRDPDVAANLQLARAQTRDRLDAEAGGALVSMVRRLLVDWTTPEESALMALVLWVLLCALVTAVILWPPLHLRYLVVAVSVLLALSLLSVGVRISDGRSRVPAIIVVQSVEVHSGPGTDYLTEFSLHAGAEVRVLEQREDWLRIALPGGLQGWVPGEAVEKL
jgi:hypothetical protein